MPKKTYDVDIPSWIDLGEIKKVKGGYKFRNRRFKKDARARGIRYPTRESAQQYQKSFRTRMLNLIKMRDNDA